MFALGLHEFYSLICMHPVCVRGGDDCDGVFPRRARGACALAGLSWASSAVDLTLRNTRRYGGYIVHMGMVLIFVGLAGAAFNQGCAERDEAGLDAADRSIQFAAAEF